MSSIAGRALALAIASAVALHAACTLDCPSKRAEIEAELARAAACQPGDRCQFLDLYYDGDCSGLVNCRTLAINAGVDHALEQQWLARRLQSYNRECASTACGGEPCQPPDRGAAICDLATQACVNGPPATDGGAPAADSSVRQSDR